MGVKSLFKIFVDSGMTKHGACGMLANIKEESNFKANNLQNTGNKKLDMTDAEYTDAVDNGIYTREDFVKKHKSGFGICQWTYHTRKAALYDFAKKNGKSIGDESMQAEFLIWELKKNYKAVWKILCSTDSVREATETVMLKFEKPKNKSQDAIDGRVKTGEKVYAELVGEPVKKIIYFPKYIGKSSSIVDGLIAVGAPGTTYAYRKTVAAANKIENYKGTGSQNKQMLKLLKNGKLIMP